MSSLQRATESTCAVPLTCVSVLWRSNLFLCAFNVLCVNLARLGRLVTRWTNSWPELSAWFDFINSAIIFDNINVQCFEMLCNDYKRLLCFDCQHCESDLSLSSVSVASLDPPVAEDMKMLDVVLIRCIWQTCLHSCSAVIHIRCGVSIDVSTQQCRLLQRCASWHTDWHHPETAASLEQCSSDCAPGIEAILCHVIAAASSAVDHIQVGSSDVQSLGHITPSYCTYMTESCYVSAAELCICQLSDLGLLRPFVFYNRLAIGQKDRLTSQP